MIQTRGSKQVEQNCWESLFEGAPAIQVKIRPSHLSTAPMPGCEHCFHFRIQFLSLFSTLFLWACILVLAMLRQAGSCHVPSVFTIGRHLPYSQSCLEADHPFGLCKHWLFLTVSILHFPPPNKQQAFPSLLLLPSRIASGLLPGTSSIP